MEHMILCKNPLLNLIVVPLKFVLVFVGFICCIPGLSDWFIGLAHDWVQGQEYFHKVEIIYIYI